MIFNQDIQNAVEIMLALIARSARQEPHRREFMPYRHIGDKKVQVKAYRENDGEFTVYVSTISEEKERPRKVKLY